MPELLNVAVDTARAAGELLLPFFERRVRIEYKGDVDLVTEADRASEKLIVARIRSNFPITAFWPRKAPAANCSPSTAGTSTRSTAPPILPMAFRCGASR